jgi:hypothetical protein
MDRLIYVAPGPLGSELVILYDPLVNQYSYTIDGVEVTREEAEKFLAEAREPTR